MYRAWGWVIGTAALSLSAASCVNHVSGDAGVDAYDASVEDIAQDAPGDALSNDTADAANDTSEDAARVAFSAMIRVDTFTWDCRPDAAMDPAQFVGEITIVNGGNVPLGPVSATEAVIIHGADEVARFTIEPVTIDTVAPGASGRARVTKVDGSLMPNDTCMAIMCNWSVRFRIPIHGMNIPMDAAAFSPPTLVNCRQ